MKKVIVLFFLIVLPMLAFSQDNCFMEVRFFKGAEDNLTDMGMLSTYTCDREAVCEGIMYITRDMVGIASGKHILDVDSTLHEVHFSLAVQIDPKGATLVGNIYSMYWDPEADYMLGSRKNLKQDIKFNKAELIQVGMLSDKTPLWMQVKLAGQQIENNIPDHPIVLKTVIDKAGGENFMTNTISEIHDNIQFQTSSSYSTEKERASLDYQVMIHIDSLPSNYNRPYTTTLQMIRRYNIMRQHYSSSKADSKESYQSTYSKVIELERGKTIKIVFPPDSPSEHEFRVTDTLIIRP